MLAAVFVGHQRYVNLPPSPPLRKGGDPCGLGHCLAAGALLPDLPSDVALCGLCRRRRRPGRARKSGLGIALPRARSSQVRAAMALCGSAGVDVGLATNVSDLGIALPLARRLGMCVENLPSAGSAVADVARATKVSGWGIALPRARSSQVRVAMALCRLRGRSRWARD